MVYDLCLTKRHAIPIYSPRRKGALNKEFTSKDLAALLRVNKKFNVEASESFYSKNTWVIGNGVWGSTTQTNLHALQKFYQRVPASNRMHIKDVIIEIHSRRHQAHVSGRTYLSEMIPPILSFLLTY
jgi:predicted ATPase